jgi:hypothetical protein
MRALPRVFPNTIPMEGALITLFAAALYFGWLWNNRGASEYQQELAEIRFQERVKRRKALKRRVIKRLERRSKTSPHFNPNRPVEQELRTTN